MRILVTGANGYLGQGIVKAIIESGNKVIATDFKLDNVDTRATKIEYLTKLYNSLLNQKFNNFEWVIVDDGSTDGTKLIVGEFIKENKININYIYQKNEGKHIAFNNGVKNSECWCKNY